MDMHEDIGKILLTEEEIKARVRELGVQLKKRLCRQRRSGNSAFKRRRLFCY